MPLDMLRCLNLTFSDASARGEQRKSAMCTHRVLVLLFLQIHYPEFQSYFEAYRESKKHKKKFSWYCLGSRDRGWEDETFGRRDFRLRFDLSIRTRTTTASWGFVSLVLFFFCYCCVLLAHLWHAGSCFLLLSRRRTQSVGLVHAAKAALHLPPRKQDSSP